MTMTRLREGVQAEGNLLKSLPAWKSHTEQSQSEKSERRVHREAEEAVFEELLTKRQNVMR